VGEGFIGAGVLEGGRRQKGKVEEAVLGGVGSGRGD